MKHFQHHGVQFIFAVILMLTVLTLLVTGCSSGTTDATEAETTAVTDKITEQATLAADSDDSTKAQYQSLKVATMATVNIEVPTFKFDSSKLKAATISYEVGTMPEIEVPTFSSISIKPIEFEELEHVQVDEDTGEITLDASVLFASDSYEISDAGKKALREFLDAYTEQIFSEENKGKVTKIYVEGHTDTNGSHEYNQTLSENRAKAVKDYCIEQHPELKEYLVAKGYSYDNPVLNSDGSVNMEASRRVVFRAE